MSLVKDSTIYLIGEILSKALPFLMLPYLTRKLGAEGFGELSYYLVWLALLNVFIGLSQEGAVARYYYFYGKRSINMIVRAGYTYSTFIAIIFLLAAYTLNNKTLIYLTILALTQTLLNVQLSLRQCQKKPFQYITIQIIFSLSTILLTILFLEFFASPEKLVDYRILALLGANLTAFLIAISFVSSSASRSKVKLSKDKLKLSITYILAFGLPLIFHHLSFFAKGQVDRLFIYGQYTASELGIYSAGVQLAMILPAILLAINKALVPYLYQSLKERYSQTATKIIPYAFYGLLIAFIPALVAFLIPTSLYTWFLGEAYYGAKYFTISYLLSFGLNLPYLILVNFLFYKGLNKKISLGSFISTIIYLLGLMIFSKISITWIPFSLLISNIILLVYLTLCVKKNLH